MKKVIYLGVALCAMLTMASCKSKESAYKKAYENAKQQELAQQAEISQVEAVVADVPVVVKEKATVSTPVTVRQERVTPQGNASMKEFNVVCGSFSVLANAEALTERMKSAGYPAFMALNPETKLYRVIIGTFDNKAEAGTTRDNFKAKYPNDENFQGAWILQRTY